MGCHRLQSQANIDHPEGLERLRSAPPASGLFNAAHRYEIARPRADFIMSLPAKARSDLARQSAAVPT